MRVLACAGEGVVCVCVGAPASALTYESHQMRCSCVFSQARAQFRTDFFADVTGNYGAGPRNFLGRAGPALSPSA